MSKIRWKPILITAAAVVLALAMINACVLLLLDADEKSKDARILDRAVTEASSVADTLKATDGSLKKRAGSCVPIRYMTSRMTR